MLSNVIKCPECNKNLFVRNEEGYMVGDIILVKPYGDYFNGKCGCGFHFKVIDGIFMEDDHD